MRRRIVPVMGGGGVTALAYRFFALFTSDVSAPLPNPYTADVGTLTPIQTDGEMSISSAKLNFPAQTTATYGDQGFYLGATAARVSGRAMYQVIKKSAGLTYFGYAKSAGVSYTQFEPASLDFHSNNNIYIFKSDGNIMPGSNLRTWISGTEYPCLVVQRSAGALFFVKVSGTWYLYIVNNQGTSNVTPAFGNYSGVGTIDDLRVFDMGSPWNSDFGICTNYSASPSANDTTTHEANGMVEMIWTSVTGQTWNLMVRRTDDSNCWAIRGSQGGSTIKLIEINAGVETERASAGATWNNANAYRVSVYMDGNKIRVHWHLNTGMENELLYYASASFNNTATGAKTDRAGSNLAAWPLTLSGAALTELERWI